MNLMSPGFYTARKWTEHNEPPTAFDADNLEIEIEIKDEDKKYIDKKKPTMKFRVESVDLSLLVKID